MTFVSQCVVDGRTEHLQGHVLLDEAGRSVRLGVTVIALSLLVGVEDVTDYLQHTTKCEPGIIECADTAAASLDSMPEPTLEPDLE